MKNLQKWTLSLVAMSTIIGSLLGQIINYIQYEEFYFNAMLGTITSAAILIIINIIIVYIKIDKAPKIDERKKNKITNFLAYSSQLFLILLFIVIGIIALTGIENISIIHLLIILMVYFSIAGIGAFIIKSK